jgi:hypothetical protein
MNWLDNIDSGHSSSQLLDGRHGGCRRTLDYLLSIHPLNTRPIFDRPRRWELRAIGA